MPRVVAAVVAAVVVPVGVVAAVPALRANVPLTAVLAALYECGVLLVGFATSIMSQLRGRWSVRSADAFDAWVQRLLSRYTRLYLRYVAAETRYVDLKGMSAGTEFTLEMKDVYVRLVLDSDPARRVWGGVIESMLLRPATQGRDIWEWLRDSGRFVGSVVAIVGPPGAGKTAGLTPWSSSARWCSAPTGFSTS